MKSSRFYLYFREIRNTIMKRKIKCGIINVWHLSYFFDLQSNQWQGSSIRRWPTNGPTRAGSVGKLSLSLSLSLKCQTSDDHHHPDKKWLQSCCGQFLSQIFCNKDKMSGSCERFETLPNGLKKEINHFVNFDLKYLGWRHDLQYLELLSQLKTLSALRDRRDASNVINVRREEIQSRVINPSKLTLNPDYM